jgi:hypothetical protein
MCGTFALKPSVDRPYLPFSFKSLIYRVEPSFAGLETMSSGFLDPVSPVYIFFFFLGGFCRDFRSIRRFDKEENTVFEISN